MWRDQEENAIMIGLDLNYFWTLTPSQFMKHLRVYNKKQKEKQKEKDSFYHLLGKYVSWAVHDPKHYPKSPFLSQKEEVKTCTSVDEMERNARLNTIKLGGVINDS